MNQQEQAINREKLEKKLVNFVENINLQDEEAEKVS